MKEKLDKKIFLKYFVGCTLLVPLLQIAYQTIYLGKESFDFLGDLPSEITLLILFYYGIIFLLGCVWMLQSLRSVLNLKIAIRKSELQHLKSQINPHFFFNMLNNLYGTVERDPKRAKYLILKLSEMMRYSIYETEQEKTLLINEIKYMEDYIELHKLRYRKKIDVLLYKNIDEENSEVMPLLFINLLENAFKHGVERLREGAYVRINIKVHNKILDCTITNNFDPEVQEVKSIKGVGIENLKRRLALVYPKKHILSFCKEKTIYIAKLNIEL